MKGMYGGLDPDIEVHTFDHVLYKELLYLFETNETCIQAYGILERFLFQNIHVKASTKNLMEYVETYMSEFFGKVLKQWLIVGWCPYIFKMVKNETTGEKMPVPEIVPFRYITPELHVHKKKLTYEFVYYDADRLHKRTNIKTIIFGNIEDLANGTLIDSPLRSVLGEYRYLEQMKKFSLQGEFVRSNPPVFMKSIAKKPQENDFLGEEGDKMMDDNLYDENGPEDEKYMSQAKLLEGASRNMVKNIRFHNEQMHNLTMQQNSTYYNIGLGMRSQTENNLFILPPGFELDAKPQLPETRVDPISLQKKFSSILYLALGIPETIFGFGSHTNFTSAGRAAHRSTEIRKDINIMDINSFDATLLKYQKRFKQLFRNIYEEIYKTRLKLDAIEFKPPRLYEHFTNFMMAEIIIQGELNQQKYDKHNMRQQEKKEVGQINETFNSNNDSQKKDT